VANVPNFGWVGFTMVAAGIPGALTAGMVLDRTRRYHATVRLLMAAAVLCMLGLCATVRADCSGPADCSDPASAPSLLPVAVAAGGYGFFGTAVLAAGAAGPD
jgi:hypothetical protein